MLKKSFLSVGLISTILLSGAHTSIVLAADDSSSIDSNATVQIEKNSGENGEKPVNPVDPTKPVTPAPDIDGEENPHPPSTKGPLSINYISNFRFGMNQATGQDVAYQVKPDQVVDEDGNQIEVPNYVQVTDNRGTNAGWTLTVRQDGAFMNGSNPLVGTEMVFTNPVTSGRSGSANTSPSANANFTLTPEGQEVLVMTASENQGMGTWVDRFGENNAQAPESILLKVPGDSKKVAGFYKTSLTWTLSDVPSSND